MEGTEFVLSILFGFVLPIVIICNFVSYKKTAAKLKANSSSGDTEKLIAELASVKERLGVVEAIVTDNKYQLNQELEALKRSETV